MFRKVCNYIFQPDPVQPASGSEAASEEDDDDDDEDDEDDDDSDEEDDDVRAPAQGDVNNQVIDVLQSIPLPP